MPPRPTWSTTSTSSICDPTQPERESTSKRVTSPPWRSSSSAAWQATSRPRSRGREWITAALWGGYAAPNILKWHWWRLNGYGYFWGMVAGIGGSIRWLLAYLGGQDPLMHFLYLPLPQVRWAVWAAAPDDERPCRVLSRTRPGDSGVRSRNTPSKQIPPSRTEDLGRLQCRGRNCVADSLRRVADLHCDSRLAGLR